MPGSFAAARSRAFRAKSSRLRRLSRTLRRSENGQAVAELALVLPLLLLILLAILDFGQALNTKNTANHLANLGARFAAVGTIPSGSSICDYVTSTAAPSNLQKKLGVAVTEPTETVGSQITVKVTNNYHWLRFINGTIGGITSTTVAGEATMRLENTANGSMKCEIPAP
jgi:Flp pilus assembly protein TadG